MPTNTPLEAGAKAILKRKFVSLDDEGLDIANRQNLTIWRDAVDDARAAYEAIVAAMTDEQLRDAVWDSLVPGAGARAVFDYALIRHALIKITEVKEK